MTIKDIRNELIISCIKGDLSRFIPYLLSNKVKTDMPNKMRFYRFLKHMINCSKMNSIGEWNLRIEKTNWLIDQNSLTYSFYDQVHKYARLTLVVKENNQKIYLETLPF